MKKLLSLFALLGLFGFVATPIYAQEDEAIAEDVVVEAENVVDEAVDAVDEAVDQTADEAVDDINLEWIEDFNSLFENEEFKNMLDENGVTNEEAAWAIWWLFWILAGLWIAIWILALVLWILAIIAMWKIFTKAWEAGWKSIIPFYNTYILYKIAGMKSWFWYTLIVIAVWCLVAAICWVESSAYWIVMGIACLFCWIVAIVVNYKLPRKFGWGVFASILYVLFTWICVLVLWFGNYKYQWKSEETIVEA